MDGIKIEVIGNIAKVTEKPARIVAGTAGLPVEFTFDSTWDGLTKVAVFQAGHIRKNRPIIDNESVVPVDVLLKPGHRLHIGVNGEAEDGTVALPTIWVNLGQIHAGATPGDSIGCDPGTAKKYYDLAMLAAADAEESANRADEAARRAEDAARRSAEGTSNITYFGVPYASAVDIIPLSDTEPVTMYLFGTAEGYDAVVTGEGKITNYTEDAERDYDMRKISRLHIEKGITHIGDNFMNGAYNLKHLSFADSGAITHLGARAFRLTRISGTYDFPNLNQETLDGVFWGCRKLEGITFNDKVTELGCRTFLHCTSLRYVDGIANVTTIGEGVFQGCYNLERVGLNPYNTANISLGDFAFLYTSNDITIGNGNAKLIDAVWKFKGTVCIVQNEWKLGDGKDYLADLQSYRPTGVLPLSPHIPEMDWQDDTVYGTDCDWTPIIMPYKGGVWKNWVVGGCFLFSVFHIYNILNPDAPYDTFYDFVTKGINPKKIKITQSLYDALMGCESGAELADFYRKEGIDFAVGKEISAFDLPFHTNHWSEDPTNDYDSEGTLLWGICKVLGWGATTEHYFGTFDDNGDFAVDANRGVVLKKLIIDEMKAGRPVIMEIVGCGMGGHGAHAVVPVDYDSETDKFLIVDSGTAEHGVPDDSKIPWVYWLPFEAFITPHEASSIRTFTFGGDVSMYQLSENLKDIMSAATFRTKKGSFKPSADTQMVTITDIPATPKYVVIVPDVANELVFDLNYNIVRLPITRLSIDWKSCAVGLEYIYGGQSYGTSPIQGDIVKNELTIKLNKQPDGSLGESPNVFEKDITYHWTAYYWEE